MVSLPSRRGTFFGLVVVVGHLLHQRQSMIAMGEVAAVAASVASPTDHRINRDKMAVVGDQGNVAGVVVEEVEVEDVLKVVCPTKLNFKFRRS